MELEYFLTLYFTHTITKSNLCSVIIWSNAINKYTCVDIYIKPYSHPLQTVLAQTLLLLEQVERWHNKVN